MNLIKSGIILIFIGSAMVLIATILSAQKASIGGLVMIGPIPIAFGTSPDITVLAMITGLVLLLLTFFPGRKK